MRSLLYKVQFILIIIFIFPTISYAATPLHDLSLGSLINFSGKQWAILDQKEDGTTYIILNSNDGNRAFDPDNTNLFNPDDSNNIGYYLNDTFYNSLSQKDLILEHSWEIKYRNGSGSQPNVNAKIALISYNERVTTYISLLPSTTYDWWTRTPSNLSARVWLSYASAGSMAEMVTSNSKGVRPALYLKPDLLVAGTNNEVFDAILPSVPTGLTATATSYNQAQLNWQANIEPDLAGYIIYRDYVEVARVDAGVTSYNDSGLNPNTTYTYGIRAYSTSDIESNMSNAATVTTPIPPAPTDLTVSNVTPTGANATWSAVAGADSYNIYLDGTPVYNTTQTQYEIYGLGPGGNHSIEVRTVIGSVESNPGECTATFTTVSPPAVPKGLIATPLAYNQVQLSWDANTEPDLAGYIVYRNNTEITRLSYTITSYTDNHLRPNTTYSYKIAAYNDMLIISGMSYAVTVTTPKSDNLFNIPSATMTNDITAAASEVIYPLGGLIALGLGIKLCPWLITIAKTIFLR